MCQYYCLFLILLVLLRWFQETEVFYLLRVINPTARITMAINIAIPMMMTIKIPCGKDMAFSMKSVSPHALAEIKNPSKLVYIESFFLHP